MRIKCLLLLGLLFLFTDCQKDNVFIEEETIETKDSGIVSGEDIPDVLNHLGLHLDATNLKLGKIDLPFPKKLIDKKTVVKVINPENGHETYTFAVKRKRKDNHIFQVAITKYGANDFSDPYIFKISFDDALREELNRGEPRWGQ